MALERSWRVVLAAAAVTLAGCSSSPSGGSATYATSAPSAPRVKR
jgi:hypothetical protein